MTENDTPRQDGIEERGFAQTARQRALDAYEGARGSVSDVGQRAADGIDEAPLIALAGGLAVGALIAALLPRTEVETRAIGPAGQRLKDSARAAAQAAKEAGTQRLGELGLTRDKGQETLRSIFDSIGDAAKTSAQAALSTARNRD